MGCTVSVSFSISGENLDFEDCTRSIGITPTRTFVRAFEYDSSVIPTHQWMIESDREPVQSIDDAVRIILDRIIGHEERIVRYAANHGCETQVFCSVIIYEQRPLYELCSETLQSLVVLKCRFAMDVLDYSAK
jgi:hypothetical protein